MRLYGRYVLPRLIDLTMRAPAATAQRARWIPLAAGTVVEVGAGSGRNLPYYGEKVRQLYAVDPSPELARMARGRAASAAFPVDFVPAPAEAIPLDDLVADTVVTTWTLCTVADPLRALAEVRRVLNPDGRLLFVEHGRAPDARVRAWQHRLTPLWRRIGGGCHLGRPIDALLTQGGFQLEHLERGYTPGPRPFAYLYRGVARPRASRQTPHHEGDTP